jgi:hypothetical protein
MRGLTPENAICEDAITQWYKDNLGFKTSTGLPRAPMGDEWKNIKLADVRAAAKHGARAIGIPEKKIHQLSNMSLTYCRKLHISLGCGKINNE